MPRATATTEDWLPVEGRLFLARHPSLPAMTRWHPPQLGRLAAAGLVMRARPAADERVGPARRLQSLRARLDDSPVARG